MIYSHDEFYGHDVTSGLAEVWCAECDQPSLADFTIKKERYPNALCSLGTGRTDCTCCEHDYTSETVALCVEHIAARFPSELTESEQRLMDGNR